VKKWSVLRVHPQQDVKAAQRLRLQGHTVAVPREWRYGRVTGRVKSQQWRSVPATPGYVMLATPDAHMWPDILAVDGVSLPLMQDGRPASISAEAARPLLELAEAEQPGHDPHAPATFRGGDMVRVTRGPFAGVTTRIRRIVSGKAHVKLQFLRGEVAATVPLGDLVHV
jgi:transcription antitermination factor NusG